MTSSEHFAAVQTHAQQAAAPVWLVALLVTLVFVAIVVSLLVLGYRHERGDDDDDAGGGGGGPPRKPPPDPPWWPEFEHHFAEYVAKRDGARIVR